MVTATRVFEDMDYPDEAAQKADWDRIETEEKRAKQAAKAAAGLTTPDVDPRATLQDIPSIFPALLATKIQRKAARVGFDHPEMHEIYGKVDEELAEVKEEAEAAHRTVTRWRWRSVICCSSRRPGG